MPSTVTTAAAWKTAAEKIRRRECEELELPSGVVVQARRPQLETWLLRGRIPEALSGVVLALAGGDAKRRPLEAEDIAMIGAFNRVVVIATVVEPRVVEGAAGKGEISFGDIPDEDAEFILAWARRAPEVASLETFRHRAGLPSGGDRGEDVRPAAKPDASGDGSGAGARPGRRRGRSPATA